MWLWVISILGLGIIGIVIGRDYIWVVVLAVLQLGGISRIGILWVGGCGVIWVGVLWIGVLWVGIGNSLAILGLVCVAYGYWLKDVYFMGRLYVTSLW